MRYLIVVRHAKAEGARGHHDDVDRHLSGRGRRQCEVLRTFAMDPDELGRFGPVTALVSTAARTRETFERAFAGTTFVADVLESERLYNGVRDVSADDLLHELVAVDPLTTSLLVVAHNPTVHELLWTLVSDAREELREVPTASAYVLALEDDRPVAIASRELIASYRGD